MDNNLKTKIAFFTKYDESGASSRYRTYQYLPTLPKNIKFSVYPLLSKDYINKRFSNSQSLKIIIKSALRRLIQVIKAPHEYDFLIIEYELLPYFPSWLEHYLNWRKMPYIVDYDDALFHQYDQHRNIFIRTLLKKKIAKVMYRSEQVIVGNQYLSDYAKKTQAKRISIIPTVINLTKYSHSRTTQKKKTFTIVWIGSPSTTPYIKEIIPALQILNKKHKFRLRLIGAQEISLPGIDVEYLSWEQEKEVEYISQCHVGIMPLPDTPWTQGKCGFKLIQYMACGLPVIASPVGINTKIVKQNINGFLASTTQEWTNSIEKFLNNKCNIIAMGEIGKKIVEKKYCLQVSKKKYASILKSVQYNSQ